MTATVTATPEKLSPKKFILSELGKTIPGLVQDLDNQGKAWQIIGHELAKDLESNAPIWSKRIRFSNQTMGETTVQSAGFVGSLKGIVGSPYFGRLSRGLQLKVIEAYWEGQKRALPEVFKSPQDYVLQKSLGVQVMHSVFNDVVEIVRSNSDPVDDPASFEKVLAGPLANLSESNREGSQVSGADFWLSGPKGAAGAFSSSAGRRVLTARLKAALPQIE